MIGNHKFYLFYTHVTANYLETSQLYIRLSPIGIDPIGLSDNPDPAL
jgi:hypothetical protein